MQKSRTSAGKKTLVFAYFILFSVISVGVIFALISQFDTVTADQSYYESPVKMISSETMSGMSNDMSGMQGMSANMSGMQGMSANMSGMQGMSANMSGMQGMSANMSGMQGMSGMGDMSRMLGISSNEEISIFLEWMFVLILVLIGVPFAWVFLSARRKKSNLSNTAPKYDTNKI